MHIFFSFLKTKMLLITIEIELITRRVTQASVYSNNSSPMNYYILQNLITTQALHEELNSGSFYDCLNQKITPLLMLSGILVCCH